MDDHSDTDADTVGLLDGRMVSLRRLDDQDTDAVLALHEQLPDHDCYLRFFTMRPARILSFTTHHLSLSSEHDTDRSDWGLPTLPTHVGAL